MHRALPVILVIAVKAYTGRGTPLRGGLPSGHSAVAFAGWMAMTLILAREMRGRDGTVNAVAPGPTATPLFFAGKSQELIDTTRLPVLPTLISLNCCGRYIYSFYDIYTYSRRNICQYCY